MEPPNTRFIMESPEDVEFLLFQVIPKIQCCLGNPSTLGFNTARVLQSYKEYLRDHPTRGLSSCVYISPLSGQLQLSTYSATKESTPGPQEVLVSELRAFFAYNEE
jgi:hypothetical protein